MKILVFLSAVLVFGHEAAIVVRSEEESTVNDRPIIGVLSQEQTPYLYGKFPEEKYTSYIAASYVKDIEKSGARVVPIMIGKDRSYYEDLMKKINGVLFPGGSAFFSQRNGYADAGQHIYEIAMQMNEAGDYFPIFGTCLGFELLLILALGRGKEEYRVRCFSYANTHLDFTPDFQSSKLFEQAPLEVVETLANEDATINAHQFCIVDEMPLSELDQIEMGPHGKHQLSNKKESSKSVHPVESSETLKSHNLTDWRVSSHSDDFFGKKFIASVEHRRYPFYGVQFHPEKPSFEWKSTKYFVHTTSAVKANRYFMDFFIGECKKSQHSFKSLTEENQSLIYNYAPKFTGALGSAFTQCYMFEPRGNVI